METNARRSEILRRVNTVGFVRLADLISELGAARRTIRRDIDALADEGLVEKLRGGAMAVNVRPTSAPPPTSQLPDIARSLTIGMMVPTADLEFRSVISGVRSVLDPAEAGLSLMTCGYNAGAEEELVIAERLIKLGCDALLLTPGFDTVPGELAETEAYDWIDQLSVPVVLVGRQRPTDRISPVWSVSAESDIGSMAAVRHLQDYGHRRISLVVPDRGWLSGRAMSTWMRALKHFGLDTDTPVFTGEEVKEWPIWSHDEVDQLLHEIKQSEVTGLVCRTDASAMVVAQHARSQGWRIPDDLSVIGFGDRLAEIASPPLTSVSVPMTEIGETAAQCALAILTSNRTLAPRRILLQPQLVIRGSTARRH